MASYLLTACIKLAMLAITNHPLSLYIHSAAGNLAILILYSYLLSLLSMVQTTQSAVGHELTPCLCSTCIVNDSMASDLTILPSSKDLQCAVCTGSPKHLSYLNSESLLLSVTSAKLCQLGCSSHQRMEKVNFSFVSLTHCCTRFMLSLCRWLES